MSFWVHNLVGRFWSLIYLFDVLVTGEIDRKAHSLKLWYRERKKDKENLNNLMENYVMFYKRNHKNFRLNWIAEILVVMNELKVSDLIK